MGEQAPRRSSAYAQQVIALGDFNLPKRAQGDRVYDALTSKGMRLPEHSTRVGGSNVRDDAHYDQMAVWPGALDDAIEQVGIFDFDGAVSARCGAAARRPRSSASSATCSTT